MLLIKNTQIIDGTGQPSFKGDILIKDNRISAIGNFPNQKAEQIIDGLGLTLTPGFIDCHSTSDHYLTLFTNPSQKDFLLQGVTTIIGGQCGSSLAPLLYGSLKSIRKWADPDQINVGWVTLAELKSVLRRLGLGVNFTTLVGHSTIRRDLIGEEIRDLTDSEMDIFKNTLSNSLKEGGRGLSAGLGYSHSKNVPYIEIKNLLAVLTKYKGVYATHLRDERGGLVESVKETIQIAKESKASVIISHFRPILGWENQFREAKDLIDANLNKANLYLEMNPFNASVLPIYTLLPAWAQHGGLENMLAIISQQRHRVRILKELGNSEINPKKLIIAEARDNNSIVGKNLKEFSENRGLNICDGLLAIMEITRMKALFLHQNINSELLKEALFHPRALIGSNSASPKDSPALLKPERSLNTFTQFLKMAAEKGVRIEKSIQKITSSPAEIFGLEKRGTVKEGWFADLAMFKDNQMVNVIVNGQIAVQDGKITDNLAGLPI
ncbi:MAG: amidohydrolase family protein [Candidatus Harrisonbacteria bacterium]|nr:amidohydrolase family protein [Candidatus Harrisonbacteria bacterium]